MVITFDWVKVNYITFFAWHSIINLTKNFHFVKFCLFSLPPLSSPFGAYKTRKPLNSRQYLPPLANVPIKASFHNCCWKQPRFILRYGWKSGGTEQAPCAQIRYTKSVKINFCSVADLKFLTDFFFIFLQMLTKPTAFCNFSKPYLM